MIANFPYRGMALKPTLVLKKDWDIQRKILWDLFHDFSAKFKCPLNPRIKDIKVIEEGPTLLGKKTYFCARAKKYVRRVRSQFSQTDP